MHKRKKLCANISLSAKYKNMTVRFRKVSKRIIIPGSFFDIKKIKVIPIKVKKHYAITGVSLNIKRFIKSSFNTFFRTIKTEVVIITVPIKNKNKRRKFFDLLFDMYREFFSH